jgi:hypothetical protein
MIIAIKIFNECIFIKILPMPGQYIFGEIHFANGTSQPLNDGGPFTFQDLLDRIYPDAGVPVTDITMMFKSESGKRINLGIYKNGIGILVDGQSI